MTYLVLARKYRPRTFEGMVGQEHVVQALSNALTQQRLHHAYLFTGTRGVGKTTVSRVLAKCLNCMGLDNSNSDVTATPCGQCSACTDIDAGRFVDYIELDAASNRGVEEITALLDQSVYKPVMGRFKVYMIDEVHMLSNHAFNAMLKTLEEPPSYLKFVLATTDPQKVPPTVLSRCLQFNLRPMSASTVQAHLQQVLAQENIATDAGALRLISRAARGSMRDALSLADQAIAYGAGKVQEAAVRSMLGSVDRSHVLRLVQALVAADAAAVIASVDVLRDLGLSASAALEEMATLLQHMAVVQVAPDVVVDTDWELSTVKHLAAHLPADQLQLLYSLVLHGRAELDLAPDEHSGLVMVLLRMLAFRPVGALVHIEPASASKPQAEVEAAPEVQPQAAQDTSPTPVTVQEVGGPAPALIEAQALEPEPVGGAHSHQPAVGRVDHSHDLYAKPPEPHTTPPIGSVPEVLASTPVSELPSEAPTHLEEQTAITEPETPAIDEPVHDEDKRQETVETPLPLTSPNDLNTRWAQHVRQLCDGGLVSALVRELAMQAQCVGMDETDSPYTWRLRVERESLRTPALQDKLQAICTEALGQPVRIEIEAGVAQDSPAKRQHAKQAAQLAEAERTIETDPLVCAILAQYKTARIVSGSIQAHSPPQ